MLPPTYTSINCIIKKRDFMQIIWTLFCSLGKKQTQEVWPVNKAYIKDALSIWGEPFIYSITLKQTIILFIIWSWRAWDNR